MICSCMCNGTHEGRERVGTVLLLADEFVKVALTGVPSIPQVTELEDEEVALYGKHASKLSCTVCKLKVA